ncbi:undecaprenyl-phosphate glucose phosphotransferase [Pedobacter mucosus]|uniref:undecaprenyl-phosphate glucose phosphotransferase n=1 Tax=Pedobacter mucosus TaxID=2895286 RepID=UPI001EE4C39E|nr:undecaprenyl-phosphate glucose phosphotransferase [Pedobacter mucosus]UKT63243.1 undecaprenyl-phosphate glucose phosphotransferase [Pedobacter mucosus]
MQTRYLFLLKYILPITDLLMVNVVYFFSFELTRFFGRSVNSELQWHYVVVCNLVWIVCTTSFGLYTDYGSRRIERIYRGTWRSVILHFFLFAFYLFFSKQNDFSRTFLVVFYGILGILFLVNRFIGTSFQFLVFNHLRGVKSVAIMGNNATGLQLATYFEKQRYIEFHGFIGKDIDEYLDRNGHLSDAVGKHFKMALDKGIKDIYVTIAPERMAEMAILTEEAERQCVRLKFIPDIGGALLSPYTVSYLGNEFPVISLRSEPLEKVHNRFKKRVIDVVFSGLIILFVLSWLYPIIAILIKMQSKGPVLFKQLRSGRDDEPFWCFKFRSMRMNADSDKRQASKDDDRITSIGKFLRKSSLDELPQFFNVFMGHMSVVGPRPHMLSHTEQYKGIVDQFMVRHFLKPGITGWAQVNGYRGETKEDYKMIKRVEFDIWYLEHWTAALDVKIIFMTAINMAKGEENAF